MDHGSWIMDQTRGDITAARLFQLPAVSCTNYSKPGPRPETIGADALKRHLEHGNTLEKEGKKNAKVSRTGKPNGPVQRLKVGHTHTAKHN